MLVGTGQLVEERRLAAVLVAREGERERGPRRERALLLLVVELARLAEARMGDRIDGADRRIVSDAGHRFVQTVRLRDGDLGGVRQAERQRVSVDPQLHRVAERRVFDQFDLSAGDQAHIQEMLAQGALAPDRQDDGMPAYR